MFPVTPQYPSEPLSLAPLPLPGLHLHHLSLAEPIRQPFKLIAVRGLAEGGEVRLQQPSLPIEGAGEGFNLVLARLLLEIQCGGGGGWGGGGVFLHYQEMGLKASSGVSLESKPDLTQD